jgi:hypothetical protein
MEPTIGMAEIRRLKFDLLLASPKGRFGAVSLI